MRSRSSKGLRLFLSEILCSDEQILSNLAHVSADECYTWLEYSTVSELACTARRNAAIEIILEQELLRAELSAVLLRRRSTDDLQDCDSREAFRLGAALFPFLQRAF